MNLAEADDLSSGSEDEDYFPCVEAVEVVSEDDEGGDAEGKTEKKQGQVRKKDSSGGGKKKTKRRKKDDDESADDSDDTDFTINEKESENEHEEDPEDPEIIAKREKAEKERTDGLWADFLDSVEQTKAKRKEEKESGIKAPQEQIVTKVYEFAGERVKVQEKVRVDASKPSVSSPAVTNGDNKDVSHSNGSSAEPESPAANGSDPDISKGPRKLRISFLSGNPSDIGLAGGKGTSAKEGLANVLNALQAKNKKIGTLEKSKLDWESYKRDQNISEELSSHNRSRNGFVDKQEFLHRADLRQFEIEKEARTKRRKPMQ